MENKNKILNWCKDKSYISTENSFVAQLREYGFEDEHVVAVINALENTCHHCFDGPRNCQCWNDE